MNVTETEEPQLNTFWGAEVLPGPKPTPFVPPGDVQARLHLSTACLTPGAEDGTKVYLRCKVQDQQPLVIAVLRAGGAEMMGLDLVYDEYTEFSVHGTATVHLTGYYMPMEMEEETWKGDAPDDSDDEDYTPEETAALQSLMNRRARAVDDEDSESDSDEVPLAVQLQQLDGSDSEDEPASDSSDSVLYSATARRQSTVIVEEIETEQPVAQTTSSSKKRKINAAAALKSPAQPAPKVTAPKSHPTAAKSAAAMPAKKAGAAATPLTTPSKSSKTALPTSSSKPSQSADKATKRTQKLGDEFLNGASTSSPLGRDVRKFPNGLTIENVAMGSSDGKLAKAGKRVKMRYCGKLESGRIFDQTKGNKTFSFRLGVGEVISGWDKGIEGMRVGDKRKLTVPPSMAYGNRGAPPSIPPKATLVFEVELVNVT